MKTPLQAALAKLHIAKKDLAMADDSYRQLLTRHGAPAESPSSRNMTINQIDAVLKELVGKGWQPKRRKKSGDNRQSPPSSHSGRKTRIDKIRAIWIQMHRAGFISDGSETALMAWVRKQTRAKNGQIDALEWLEQTNMTNTVLEQLKQWQRRVVNSAMNGDLLLIMAAVPALAEHGQIVTQAEATQILLDHHVITWNPLFEKLAIKNSEHYATSRMELRPMSVIVGDTAEGQTCS
ncbi:MULTISPECIES: gp16 family protein [unclassified Oceanobacter]|uniref:gp16 family protein n=1 Tax=unclassified Oceanobacter TaxID=2620260 RepID=UPI0027335936|nr:MULTISPECIES: regulatory protein GemA [unclassified Oceanobacter]MDP2607969.1 regulatory protein GemA [Oceanobacter sp. 1_MG-2023]MDP2611369.1 regulatory protein GemA [Oceanobacter sp. 2_MG-2023]